MSEDGNTAGGTDQYHFMVPVWGEQYVSLFLKYVLPSHLTAGNLQSLPLGSCTYQVFTRKLDLPLFENSPVFAKLKKLVNVVIETVEPNGDNYLDAYKWMTACYNMGMDYCKNRDVALVFICPDCIYGNNSFKNLHRLQSQGKRAIMVCGVRVLKEEFLPVLDGTFGDDKTVLDMSHRDLVRLMYDHLHPLSAAHICKNNMNSSPQLFFWQVENEGILAHCFHVHPLLIRPQDPSVRATATVDGDFLLDTIQDYSTVHVVKDSDEIFFVDATPLTKHTYGPFGFFDIGATQVWAQSWTNKFHRNVFRDAIYLHSADISPKWDQYKAKAAILVAAILRDIPDHRQVQETAPDSPRSAVARPFGNTAMYKAVRWCYQNLARRPLKWTYQKLFGRVLGSVQNLQASLAATNLNINYLRTRLAYLERNSANDSNISTKN